MTQLRTHRRASLNVVLKVLLYWPALHWEVLMLLSLPLLPVALIRT